MEPGTNDRGPPDGAPPWRAHTHGSKLVEQALEYQFLGQLTAELLRRNIIYEIMRGDFDTSGHDLVIEANGVMRHIQLKVTVAGGRTASVPIHTALAAKPSGCVIRMLCDPATFAITGLRWFGAGGGGPLPCVGDKPVRHTRGNRNGVKAIRPMLRALPLSKFRAVGDIVELVDLLFGDRSSLLLSHLATREADPDAHAEWIDAAREGCFEAIPTDLDWERSLPLAMMIGGYELADQLGLGDPMAYEGRQLDHATSTGRWAGDALELWVTLFLEHRRWRFSGSCEPSADMAALLDMLVGQLREALLAMPRRPMRGVS